MLKKIELFGLIIAGMCIVSLGLLITITVAMRSLFGNGFPDDVTIVSELMVGAIFLPLAYVTANYSHITIEFVFNLMGAKSKLWTLAVGSIISLVMLVPLVFASWKGFSHAVDTGSYFFGVLDLPEWPGKFAFFVGSLLFVIRLSVICITDTYAAVTRDKEYLAKRVDHNHEAIEEG